MSLKFIEVVWFQSRVHVGPGVSIPWHLELPLGIGIKHMFHWPRNADLITQVYLDFVRHLWWRIKFTLEGEDKTYDPDYDVSELSMADPPYHCFTANSLSNEDMHMYTMSLQMSQMVALWMIALSHLVPR